MKCGKHKPFRIFNGLQIEYQLEQFIKGGAGYLKDYGPLSITVDAKPPFGGSIHALLLLGIYGGIDGQHTAIVYIDPADGLLHNEPFMDFLPSMKH